MESAKLYTRTLANSTYNKWFQTNVKQNANFFYLQNFGLTLISYLKHGLIIQLKKIIRSYDQNIWELYKRDVLHNIGGPTSPVIM